MDACAVDDSGWLEKGADHAFQADIYANNTCIMRNQGLVNMTGLEAAGPTPAKRKALYHFSHCDISDLANTVDKTGGNMFLFPGGGAAGADPLAVECGGTPLTLKVMCNILQL